MLRPASTVAAVLYTTASRRRRLISQTQVRLKTYVLPQKTLNFTHFVILILKIIVRNIGTIG